MGFDLAERERDMGTKSFKQPTAKMFRALKVYDPHAEVEDQRKYQGPPGPGKYDLPTQFIKEEDASAEQRLLYNDKGKVYVENNLDRFGQPIMPRKPKDLKPGPGQYNITPRVNEEVLTTAGGFIAQQDRNTQFANKNKVPGPSYYENPNVEPKKISFLFNAAEKWVH